MYCMHAQNEASEAPRTHFRACKTSWGRAPRPPPTIYIMGPTFYICPGPSNPFHMHPWIQDTQPHVCKQQHILITHTLDVTHHTPDNQTTNLTPHSSVNIQHPHVFECTTTSHQQQWVLLSSEGTSNTTCSMGGPYRWPGTSSGVQFGPVLREVKTNTHVHNEGDAQLTCDSDHIRQC